MLDYLISIHYKLFNIDIYFAFIVGFIRLIGDCFDVVERRFQSFSLSACRSFQEISDLILINPSRPRLTQKMHNHHMTKSSKMITKRMYEL